MQREQQERVDVEAVLLADCVSYDQLTREARRVRMVDGARLEWVAYGPGIRPHLLTDEHGLRYQLFWIAPVSEVMLRADVE